MLNVIKTNAEIVNQTSNDEINHDAYKRSIVFNKNDICQLRKLQIIKVYSRTKFIIQYVRTK